MTTDSTQTESNELTFQKDAHLHPEFVDGKFRFSIVVDSDTEAFHDAAVAHCGNNDSSMNITLDQCEVPSVFRLPKGGFHATSLYGFVPPET